MLITDCEHSEKVVVGGSRLSICKECRLKNLEEFYSKGTDYVLPVPEKPHWDEPDQFTDDDYVSF